MSADDQVEVDPEQNVFRDGAVERQATLEDTTDDQDVDVDDAGRIPDVDTLWVILGTTRDYHVSEDCPQLQRSVASDPVEKPVDVYPDADDPDEWCSYCLRPEQSTENGAQASAPQEVEPEDTDPCEHGDDLCDGLDALEEGRLPCWECFKTAPQALIDEFNQVRRREEENRPTIERSGGEAGA